MSAAVKPRDIAREIAGPRVNAETQEELARRVEIDLGRVRYARHQLLSDNLSSVTSTPEEPAKLATIASQKAKQLLAMDRYEQRAAARRKFAIRAFDAAIRQAARVRGMA